MKAVQPFYATLMAIGLGMASFAAGVAQARPIFPAENRFFGYTGNLPACVDAGVLGTITSRFQQKESEYWNSALQIVGYDRIHESGFRTNGLDYIPRRYCTARARLNDNHLHKVTYWIGEDLGIIGYGYGVEWCVGGLDRNMAYSPACKAARH